MDDTQESYHLKKDTTHVVIVEEKNYVELVPRSWLILTERKCLCYYPNRSQHKHVKKWVQINTEPDRKNWKQFKVKILKEARAKLFQTSRRWSLDRPRFLSDESSSLRKAVSRRAEGEGEIEKEKRIIVQQKALKPSAGPVSAADSATQYCASIAILAISISPIPINRMLANSWQL
ncbi:hypothetical protein ALC57_15013 [Trachymyrmex cornetzi]|uniref:Uncharacterized protein n=1 Tax=Trachymyrmex cornetzi TaxID=471704 RepID=A0A195DJ82_9HYME|nr:hypothetical protein ALC57_15013 [Trachymyrmex cornetzi]